MDAPVPLIAVALLAAAALVVRGERARAWAMLGALALAPVILVAHIADTEQVRPLRDDPALLAAAAAAALVVLAALGVLFARHPGVLLVAAIGTLPFRVPIAVGGSTANLLVPLYLVVAAGTLAFAVPRLGQERDEEDGPPAGALEWVLAVVLVLYAIQATYSSDFDRALENTVFFYVPFALLFVLLRRRAWSPRILRVALGVLLAVAVALAGVGFGEYATRHLLLNPKVIASNQLEDYFRVNSMFFDPNIYGRFLAVTMLLAAAWLLWSTRRRDVLGAGALLLVLWAGLVLTFSQSSFAALLAGLAVLGGLRWRPRWALGAAAATVAVAVAFVALASDTVRVDLGSSESADAATSGRYELVEGGVELFAERPLTGWGSGAFAREYRRAEDVSAERATSASHTIPVTVAAEQGVPGLLAYLALVGLALARLLRRARESPWRAAIAAAFAALVVHTLLYAAFLEDPLAWALAGVGSALALRVAPAHRRRTTAPASQAAGRAAAPAAP